jgi:hypothetical protein
MQLEVTEEVVRVGEKVYPLGRVVGGLEKASWDEAPLTAGDTLLPDKLTKTFVPDGS